MDRWKLEPIQIEEKKKRQALQQIRKTAEQKKEQYVPSSGSILYGQIKYTSKFCLAGQLMLVVLIILLFGYFQKSGVGLADYVCAASAVSAFTGLFLILELSRSQSFGMAELEQTCYLNLKQVWCIKMIVFGCIDILILSVMMGKIAVQFSMNMAVIGIYLLVPFVAANAGYLLIFSCIRGKEKLYVQTGLAAAVSILAALFPQQERWYDMQYLEVWVMVLFAAIAMLAVEIFHIYSKASKGEIICWN